MVACFARRLFALLLAFCSLSVMGQTPPTVRLIVPFPPGGGSDLFARLIAPGLDESLQKSVIVENRAGAGGVMGANFVAKSLPDGNTFLLADSSVYAVSPSLYRALPYAAKDLVPVVDVGRFANMLVVPGDSPFNKLEDVIKAAQSQPGKLTIGSAGLGSSPHLTAEKFQQESGIKLVHVPYKGSGPAISAAMAAQVDMVFTGLPSVVQYLKAGKLKAIAIASIERSPFAPDVPTMNESGVPGFESLISQGIFAPQGTSTEVIAKVNRAVNDYMNGPKMAQRLQDMTVTPTRFTAQQYLDWLTQQSVAWSELIRKANVQVE